MNNTEPAAIMPVNEDGGAEAEPPQRLRLEIVREAGDWSAFEPVEATVEAARRALARSSAFTFETAEAVVALSSDDAVRRLNATYRGLDKPTNVLSFPMPERMGAHSGGTHFLGDIVLAAGTVAREAAELDLPPAHHLAHLVVHGVLHLLGYDHEADAGAAEMEAVEAGILAGLGIADPYAACACSGPSIPAAPANIPS